MKSFQDQDQLIVKELPGMLWFAGLFFATIGGIFVYGSMGGFSNSDTVPRWQLIAAFFAGAVGFFVGLQLIFNSPATTITIDRTLENLCLRRIGLSGVTEKMFSFNQIDHFHLIEECDSDGDLIWSLAIQLADGSVERISTIQSHCQDYKRKFVFETNLFMNKQIPSTATFFELEDDKSPEIS